MGYPEQVVLWREEWRVSEQSKRSLSWAGRATVHLLLLVKVSFERTRCVGVTCLPGLARVLRLL